MSTLLPFESLHNTRDLGGMKTKDGRIIKPGKLIRSGHLSEASEADRQKLGGMLSVVVDFRTEQERLEKPDGAFPGVECLTLPVMESMAAGITREEASMQELFSRLLLKPEEAKQYMILMYQGFVESEAAASAYREFLKVLLSDHEKAVLWHCTAGKDRAGIASVLVEEILGVSKEDIVADYFATNQYLKEDIRFLTNYVKQIAGTQDAAADESLRYLFGAEKDFILAFFDAVTAKYGGMEAFLKDVLCVDEEMKERMKELYLQ